MISGASNILSGTCEIFLILGKDISEGFRVKDDIFMFNESTMLNGSLGLFLKENKRDCWVEYELVSANDEFNEELAFWDWRKESAMILWNWELSGFIKTSLEYFELFEESKKLAKSTLVDERFGMNLSPYFLKSIKNWKKKLNFF